MSTDEIKVVPIAGKGQGIVACRPFARGDVVLSEKPLFTQPRARTNASIAQALKKCSRAEQQEFLSLHNCHKRRLPSEPLRGTFETNCWPCGDNGGGFGAANTGGLFLISSRFNSSCTPNINNRWNDTTGVLEFRAVRSISVGEELCAGYGNLVADRDERQQELKQKFGFDCACEACTLVGEELGQSNMRRTALAEIMGHKFSWIFGDIEPEDAMVKMFLGLRFAKQEKLFVYEWDFYFSGFAICAGVSDWNNAKEWACMAYETSRAVFGEEHAAQDKEYMKNPQIYRHAGACTECTLYGPDFAFANVPRWR